MTRGIGAAGSLGIGFEVTPGTYVAPTKFIPIRSESLAFKQNNNWRRPIRQVADNLGNVAGNVNIEGDIEIEAMEDCVVYFLHLARVSIVKGGAVNFTYTTTPTHNAVSALKTASITVIRNGAVFAYTGCRVVSQSYTIDNGLLIAKYTVMGVDETTQAAPGAFTWPTTIPFGAGQYDLSIGGGVVTDSDNFDMSIEDNGEALFRLRSDRRGPSDIKFGEREVSVKLERDFETKTEYDAFKALTATSVQLLATKGANNQITLKAPVTIKESYEVGLSGQGDLVRGAINYMGVYDPATSKSYEIVVKTQEDIV